MKAETIKKKAIEYHARFERELGHEWERLSEYKGQKAPLTAKHIPCGAIRVAPAADYFRRGCYECQRAKGFQRRYENRAAQYIAQIEAEYNVTAVTEYKGYREPMTWRCNVCGAEIEKNIDSILFRSGGPGGIKCDHGASKEASFEKECRRKLVSILKRRIKRIEREEKTITLCMQYEVNGYDTLDIGDDLTTIRLRHLKCGRAFTTSTHNMRKGCGCAACARCGTSRGVRHIEGYLRDNNIKFAREVTFPTCKRKRALPFDFAIYSDSGVLQWLVEFQGEQHYRSTSKFGGEERLKRTQEADAIKRQWCKDNGINLITIDWNEDIDAALKAIEK